MVAVIIVLLLTLNNEGGSGQGLMNSLSLSESLPSFTFIPSV